MALRLAVLLCLVTLVGACHADLPLLPRPQELEELAGDFPLTDETRIAVFPAGDKELRFSAGLVAEELGVSDQEIRPTGVALAREIVVGLPAQSAKFAAVCAEAGCVPDEALGEQGYLLHTTPERVIIAANAPAGAFYGVQTLLQLAEIGSQRKVPCVRIRDWPVMEWRGVLTDQSRQAVPKVSTYKRMIRELARHKMNFVSMHLEHTFVVEKHPIISEGTGALSAEDVREICEYAKKYHCLFFPSFEAFAHQHHILKHEPYKHLAENPGGSSFAPVQEGTYELLEDIFDEMCPAFTGTEFFNAGCDEVWDLGTGQSKELAEQIGEPALYGRHMNRVYDMLKARGKRMMMWGDMLLHHPEAIEMVPKDTIIMDWHYGPQHDYPSVKQFRDAGFDVFVIPALSSWMRLWPDYETALENIEWLIRRGREGGAIGSMTCNWGDNGNENTIASCYYGWLFAGECSWGAQAEEIDRKAFDRAFCRQFFGTRSAGPAKATHLLSQANRALGGDAYFNWRFFHDDPFVGQLRRAWPKERRVDRLMGLVNEAHEGLHGRVGRNEDVLVAMRFARERVRHVAIKAKVLAGVRQGYERAWAASGSTADQKMYVDLLMAARGELAWLRGGFVEQWSRENRPEGNDYNLRRWDAQIAAYDARIERISEGLETGELPAPAEIGLDDPRFRRALVPRLDRGKAGGEWLVPDATARRTVRIEAGRHDRVTAPLLVESPPGPWAEANQLTPDTPVMALTLALSTGHIVPVQRIAPGPEGRPAIAFALPGRIGAGDELSGTLYITWRSGLRADSASVAQPKGDGLEVDTGAYRAWLRPEGGHIYNWIVAKLGGQDITLPGDTSYSGFFDEMSTRHEPFELTLEADGPVVAVVRAVSELEDTRTFYFWRGLPYVECVLGDGASYLWAFDSTENFASDAPMPGTAYLSNGFTAPVPEAGALEQVPKTGQRAWWCCKTREDGLTLGLITPAQQTNMLVGPGGGFGGVGIERSNPAQYFVVYADVDKRGPAAVDEVYHTLARDDPIKVTFGEVEMRDAGGS